MAKFNAVSEVARQTRTGEEFKVTAGTAQEVIGAATLAATDSNAGLVPMAAGILVEQMERLKVGDKLMFNWACSVLNVKVERVS